MTFYADLTADADSLLSEFGQSVTLTHITAGAYDPDTGSVTNTTTTQTGTGAVFDFGLHQSGAAFTAGSMIISGDKQLYLSAVGITAPAAGDQLTIGSDVWSVVSVKTTAPAGTVVLYECQLRK